MRLPNFSANTGAVLVYDTVVTALALVSFVYGIGREVCASCKILSLVMSLERPLQQFPAVQQVESDRFAFDDVFRTLSDEKLKVRYFSVRIVEHMRTQILTSQWSIKSSLL